jgi:hypothetical protein
MWIGRGTRLRGLEGFEQLEQNFSQTYLKFAFQLLNRPKIISRKGRKGRQVET